MKPQSAAFLEKARELLDDTETMLRVDLTDAAGRTAYLAGFHPAQALIFETNGRVFKTHTGVRSEFARLVKDDPRIDSELRAFLGLTYQLKAITDYEIGAGSHVTAETARAALLTARRFVECVSDAMK
ncbi:MAG TPA: HEPN domain-containing protein [Methylocella sp.]|nr:HEPN domain-containing protein [Methylocella sp.]